MYKQSMEGHKELQYLQISQSRGVEPSRHSHYDTHVHINSQSRKKQTQNPSNHVITIQTAGLKLLHIQEIGLKGFLEQLWLVFGKRV